MSSFVFPSTINTPAYASNFTVHIIIRWRSRKKSIRKIESGFFFDSSSNINRLEIGYLMSYAAAQKLQDDSKCDRDIIVLLLNLGPKWDFCWTERHTAYLSSYLRGKFLRPRVSFSVYLLRSEKVIVRKPCYDLWLIVGQFSVPPAVYYNLSSISVVVPINLWCVIVIRRWINVFADLKKVTRMGVFHSNDS